MTIEDRARHLLYHLKDQLREELKNPAGLKKRVKLADTPLGLTLKYPQDPDFYNTLQDIFYDVIEDEKSDEEFIIAAKDILSDGYLSFDWAAAALRTISELNLKEPQHIYKLLKKVYDLYYKLFKILLPSDFRFGKYYIHWGVIENRPLLRLLFNRALFFSNILQTSTKARQAFEELIHLEPNDSLGVRHILMRLYLKIGFDQEAICLAKRYPSDHGPFLTLGLVLAYFRRNKLQRAFKILQNRYERVKHVIDLLTKPKVRIPKAIDNLHYYATGSREEALLYYKKQGEAWIKTEGAIKWLKAVNKKIKNTQAR